jgi:hypothetical protein
MYSQISIVRMMTSRRTASEVWWPEFLAIRRICIVFPVRYKLNLHMLCRRK